MTSATVSSAWARRTRPRTRALAFAAMLTLLTLLTLPILPTLPAQPILPTLPARSAAAETFTGRVIGIADGDTLTVLRAGRGEVVRLRGIDAPERGQAYGERAKQYAAALVFGKVVAVEAAGRDRYGRLLAEVRLPDGRSLNEELVRAGYAWWFRRYSEDRTLARLEAEARTGRRGLWADLSPVPPWEYRQTLARSRGLAGGRGPWPRGGLWIAPSRRSSRRPGRSPSAGGTRTIPWSAPAVVTRSRRFPSARARPAWRG